MAVDQSCRGRRFVCGLVLAAVLAEPVSPQGISSDGDVQSEGQLVSGAPDGTAPLEVSSSTVVENLNADRVDGVEAAVLAPRSGLSAVETLLYELMAEVGAALGYAPLAQTGADTCWDDFVEIPCGVGAGAGQDGDLRRGLRWPRPRFTKNGDGTVTDNLTSLTWLEDEGCLGAMEWGDALTAVGGLFDGSTNDPSGGDCGLSDGSVAGEWRLPNIRELMSLVHFGVVAPPIPNTEGTGRGLPGDPFTPINALEFHYSSTSTDSGGGVYCLWQRYALQASSCGKGTPESVWPVRGSPSNFVRQTGQTDCYSESSPFDEISCETQLGSGQDGALQYGVPLPRPRFSKNGDGTVTDLATGLLWLEKADCFDAKVWLDAFALASALFDGSVVDPSGGDCGLSDGSSAGDWRLPNVREAESLFDYGLESISDTAGSAPWSEGDAFSGLIHIFWTSTTVRQSRLEAYQFSRTNLIQKLGKSTPRRLWLVRDP